MCLVVCALCLLLTVVDGDVGVEVLMAGGHEVTLQNRTLARAPNDSFVVAVDYHYHKGLGFALWDGNIYRFPLFANDSGDLVSPVAIASIPHCMTFTVDWVHDHVIWPDCRHFTDLMVADLDGSNPAVLVELSRGRFTRVTDIVVDPYKGKLFFLFEGTLKSCWLDGRGLQTQISDVPLYHVSALALDLPSERTYFPGYLNGSDQLYYTGYNDSKNHLVGVFGAEVQHVWGLGVFRSQLFYLNHVADNASYLLQSSILGGRLNQTKVLASGNMFSHMKLVHPDIQSPGKVDACTFRGCSHHCVVEGAETRCLCPNRFKLVQNETICESLGVEYFTFYTVMTGTACVLFVLLSAGVLMCICDKVWSTVHPTSIPLTTPTAAAFRRSAIYKVDDDSENLI